MAYQLIFERGSLKGKIHDISDGDEVLIGRSHSCQLRTTEGDVSGRHAVFKVNGNKLYLDVLSSHRTVLNGKRLSAGMSKEVPDNSKIEFGDSLLLAVRFNQEEKRDSDAETETSFQPMSPSLGETVATRAAEQTAFTVPGPDIEKGASATLATTASQNTETVATFAQNLSDDVETSDGADETQMLATQMVSQEELDVLRGEHLRQQKKRVALKAAMISGLLICVVGLYAWLSNPYVNPHLVAPIITFEGVIKSRDGRGQIGIKVPYYNGGKYTKNNDSVVLWDTYLGEKWEVPFRIVLTNYYDPQSLKEDAKTTFMRWQKENMGGLWRAKGDLLPTPQFIGGGAGYYPGIRCLVQKYSRVGADDESFIGTASFFRIGPQCYVLLRELPSIEEGRGMFWLEEISSTLFVREKNLRDNSDNTIASRHWEGTVAEDDERSNAAVIENCITLLERDNPKDWGDIERMLYVTLRSLSYKGEASSIDERNRCLENLERLRKNQKAFWQNQCSEAFRNSQLEGREPRDKVAAATEAAINHFTSQSDERYYLIREKNWWLARPKGL